LGGPQRFCVQCGKQLKPDSRFCVGCGRSAPGDTVPPPGPAGSEQVPAGGYEVTSTMRVPTQDGPVGPGSPAEDPAWPSKGSYHPGGATLDPMQSSFPPPDPVTPSPDQVTPSPDRVSPSPDLFPPSPDQFPPSPDLFPPSPGPADPPPGPGGRRPVTQPRPRRPASQPSRRRPVLLGLAVLLAAGIVAAAVAFLVLRPSHPAQTSAGATQTSAANQGGAQATTAAPSASSTSASSSPPISEQQAATSLAGLLSQSGQDRNAINAAATDVSQCGPTLSQDPQTFQNAATSRQKLLSQLASLPGSSTLPPAMLQALTGGWQASESADQDLGKWAQDEASRGCTQNDDADTNFQASRGPDGQATTDKKAFVSQWNSVASQYGLKTYQWNQI